MNRTEATEKHSLVNSKEWKAIKTYLLEEIKDKSATKVEPLMLQGIMLAVYLVDSWEQAYQRLLDKEE